MKTLLPPSTGKNYGFLRPMVKKCLSTPLLFTTLIFCGSLRAQPAADKPYVWVDGTSTANTTMVTTGASPTPGGRSQTMSWRDNSGNLWIFGGQSNSAIFLNGLWRHNPAIGWTFVKGTANASGQPGVYGTMGVADDNNAPGSRNRGVAWTDDAGNLWMFGGQGRNTTSVTNNYLNDLWKYNITTNQWTWMKGGNVDQAISVVGTVGQPNANNTPGGRMGSIAWKDNANNLWLCGGHGLIGLPYVYSYQNDLWKYSIATNQWTCVRQYNPAGTDKFGVYGTKGLPAAANTPGWRMQGTGVNDGSGNLWLFGGTGFAGTNTTVTSEGNLNDLWKYNVTTNQWTWFGGDNAMGTVYGVYGTSGVENAANKPGSRVQATSWADSTGNFWLFGGSGFSSTANGYLNDLWKFDATSKMWTWVKGASTTNQVGIYGTKNLADTANKIGGRFGASAWRNASGNFMLFGGYGYATSQLTGALSDMWNLTPVVSSLPVTITSFTASRQGMEVLLKWATAQELNSQHFDVEHSIDGVAYSVIGTVAAKGNTTTLSQYIFTHSTPGSGAHYYRLKQVDKDGKVKYSDVKTLVIDGKQLVLTVKGNPFNENLVFTANAATASTASVHLHDLNGKSVVFKQLVLQKGVNSITLNTEGLSTGLYTLSVKSSNGTIDLKVIKK